MHYMSSKLTSTHICNKLHAHTTLSCRADISMHACTQTMRHAYNLIMDIGYLTGITLSIQYICGLHQMANLEKGQFGNADGF